MKFLGGASDLVFFLKAYKASEMIGYFPYDWFDIPNKLDEQQLPSYDDFCSTLKNSNPLDKEYDGFQKLLKTGLTEEQALKNSGSKPNGFLLDWKTTTTLNLSGNRNRCQHFRIFYGGITTRMFFLPLMLCRKKLSFIRTKG